MIEIRHLNNAPIVEAIIDIRTKLPVDFEPKSFLELKDEIIDEFPKMEERKLFSSEFGIKKGVVQPPSSTDHGLHGYFFKSEDKKKVVQFRVDGFTYSRLRPYTNWDETFEEAKTLWAMYCKIVSPESIPRLAVRYINHINVPSTGVDLNEYFTAPPKMSPDLRGVIIGFVSKIVVLDQELDIATNIVHALEKSAKPDKYLTVVYDIDSFKNGEFQVDSKEIWDVFTMLHHVKNQTFFSGITEKTARLFE